MITQLLLKVIMDNKVNICLLAWFSLQLLGLLVCIRLCGVLGLWGLVSGLWFRALGFRV